MTNRFAFMTFLCSVRNRACCCSLMLLRLTRFCSLASQPAITAVLVVFILSKTAWYSDSRGAPSFHNCMVLSIFAWKLLIFNWVVAKSLRVMGILFTFIKRYTKVIYYFSCYHIVTSRLSANYVTICLMVFYMKTNNDLSVHIYGQ